MAQSQAPNRLINEKSPYLLQHAYNPVDWYPWGKEAFEKARREDKPVFLSIGYSTCHWCHVMERESFDDEEVAALLNEHFVPVKVDREERPDIDAVYMQACQAMTGQGGWPMTVLLFPDKTPFFAGTYFPKTARSGQPGLMDILSACVHLWETDRAALTKQGQALLRRMEEPEVRAKREISREDIRAGFEQLRRRFDAKNGGFSAAPKFPTPHNLIFLTRFAALENEGAAREMAQLTLRQMYRGGIFDHIGGGFSRYSTDARWLVPHFEKMLYDNALLIWAYAEAFQAWGDALYKTVAERTADYVLREMTGEEGGFFSAQDADSEGREGHFYVFRPGEIVSVLGEEDGKAFCQWFGVTERGNFEGANILNLLDNPSFADTGAFRAHIPALYNYRQSRARLLTDDKRLTAWNALMIAALAKAGHALERGDYLTAAECAMRFIETALTRPDGRLFVRWREGEAAGDGFLDDYAFVCLALLNLYDATLKIEYLEKAIECAGTMCRLFEDTQNGGFYLYAESGERLAVRPKETYDGAMPSGNSAAGYVLARLAQLTGEPLWMERSARQMRFLAGSVIDYPSAYCFALTAAMLSLYPTCEVVIATREPEIQNDVLRRLARLYLPNTAVLLKTPENAAALEYLAPFTAPYPVPDSGARIYLCRGGACKAPFDDLDELERRLAAITPAARPS
ncbi:MAG: thioredoxin domain-containing protein [Clostridiales bacterium]|nr:thioredoxin domain-containing protein [Clostridiales bacterium]